MLESAFGTGVRREDELDVDDVLDVDEPVREGAFRAGVPDGVRRDRDGVDIVLGVEGQCVDERRLMKLGSKGGGR